VLDGWCWPLRFFATVLQAAAEIKCTSPDGKFALRMARTEEKMSIIDKKSQKVVQELEWTGNSDENDAKLVWSADSKRVVYVRPWRRGVDLYVYFRNGNSFEPVALPEDMPVPVLPDRRHRDGTSVYSKSWDWKEVKEWLKSGALVFSYGVEDDNNERDEITLTITFDGKNKARVLKTECSVRHYLTSAANKEADGDHDAAIADYSHAIKLDNKNADTYVSRGGAKESKGDLEGAIADYGQALKLDPKNSTAYSGRASVKTTRNDLDGAIADDTRIIEFDPKNSEAYINRGAVFYAKTSWKEALEDFRHAAGLGDDAGHARILVWLARVKQGEKIAADKELAASLAEKKSEDGEWDSMLARFVLGQVAEEALLKGATASEKKVLDCEAWYFIAIKHLLAGDKKAAAEDLKKCLATTREKLPLYHWIPAPEPRLVGWELKALGESR
jgi:tetratricopeptide (TPR) repeat protein